MRIVIHTEKVDVEQENSPWVILVFIPKVGILQKILISEEDRDDTVAKLKKQYGTVELTYVMRV